MNKPRVFTLLTIICASFGMCLAANSNARAAVDLVSSFDPQAAFVAYHALSGDALEDSDIEDLYWNQGRPPFSNFKPAELFTQKTLRNARAELEEQIRRTGPDTAFRWEVDGTFSRNAKEGVRFHIRGGPESLPQPTDLIRAEIPPKEWRRLEQALRRLPSSMEPVNGESRLGVILTPVRAEQRSETRNIARHDVHIPIRIIVLRPVSVETQGDQGETISHHLP